MLNCTFKKDSMLTGKQAGQFIQSECILMVSAYLMSQPRAG